MSEAHVMVTGLGKKFRRRPKRGGKAEKGDFWAIRDVSFELGPGDVIGIVGQNGAGKSTLLRLLGGVGAPTEGEVVVRGRLGGLLELGGGFLGDLTGRENALLAGVVGGLLKSEVEQRMDEIVEFAGLQEFIDEPVRTFSSGMVMRLAFSVAVHAEPRVLLVDEFLAVGDLAFQSKCRDRIERMKEGGCSIVMVSQEMGSIRELCDRALWLKDGRVAADGNAREIADAYESEMRKETLRLTPEMDVEVSKGGVELEPKRNRFGAGGAKIVNVRLVPGAVVESGQSFAVEIFYEAKELLESPVFVVSVALADGTVCLDLNTQVARVPMPDLEGAGMIRMDVDRLELAKGNYQVSVGIFRPDWKYSHDFHWAAYPLAVNGQAGGKGCMAPPVRWKLGKEVVSA
ncbi:ABC transporter ATP-binding protein [Haloferula sp.]|uniref:ABC transporter ATP-binding protein n=1 Tax=Haloferula sp. TaxID=2497595 RepID=UPI0032A0199A